MLRALFADVGTPEAPVGRNLIPGNVFEGSWGGDLPLVWVFEARVALKTPGMCRDDQDHAGGTPQIP